MLRFQYNGRNNGDLTVAWGLYGEAGLVVERYLEQSGTGFG
jgi:hypothetical protein